MTPTPALIPTLAEALARRGYATLTPVQEAVTRADLAGADLLVSAQTGSGKTVGFGLAIAPTILGDDGRFGPAGSPLALIIAPTRELALQVKRELAWLYELAGAVVASCVGGMDMRDERRALDRGAHVVVATPGRLRDHIQRGSIDLALLRAVVLDEADEMLDLGFREDLEFILGEAPDTRRTLMFSATVPKAIVTLAQNYQRGAVRITTAGERSQHADIEYRALQVAASDAENAIVNVLRFHEAPNAIIFCNTRATVNRLTTRLSNRAFPVVALSGELSQSERTHALQAMRDGRARVCVATDVAARGIDLPNLELVIHADLPTNADTLLHRSGRTGRAGRKGVSALIVPRNARRKAENLLRFARVAAEWADAPSAEAVRRRDEDRLLSDPVWTEPAGDSDAELAARLLVRHGAERIAAAYVRAFRARHAAPEELAAPDAGPRTATFGPSRWFAISAGRAQNAEPRRILPMLCRAGNLGREDVGAIRVQETETFVEVLAERVPAMLAAIGPGGRLEGDAVIRPLDAPPFGTAAPAPAEPPARRPDRSGGPGAPAKAPFSRKPAGPRRDPAVGTDDDTWPRARERAADHAAEHGLLSEPAAIPPRKAKRSDKGAPGMHKKTAKPAGGRGPKGPALRNAAGKAAGKAGRKPAGGKAPRRKG